MTVDGKNAQKNSDSVTDNCSAEFGKVENALSDYLKVENKPEAELVEKLNKVLEFLKGLDVVKSLYRINCKVDSDLTNDLKEMDFLVKELRAIVANISRIKFNRANVRKEISLIKKAKEKKNKEGIQEMETVVAIYDKELLKKWHVAKKTTAAHSLENFVSTVAGKKQAIEHVYSMAMDRLASLKNKDQCRPSSGITSAFRLKFNSSAIRNQVSDTDTESDEGFSLC